MAKDEDHIRPAAEIGPEISELLTQKSWRLAAGKVGGKPVTGEIVATERERQALAEVLELVSVDALVARFKVRIAGRNRFHLSGDVRGAVTQSCIVSGRPVAGTIDEAFHVDVWPADEIGTEEETLDPFSADPPEPLVNDEIDIGSVVYQTFAVALDPYPRHPDAKDGVDVATVEERPPSPFAALEALKKKR
jgi:uncharacterized metal-binding protein YceD (DUF177 family)